jgi:hypothetical protein
MRRRNDASVHRLQPRISSSPAQGSSMPAKADTDHASACTGRPERDSEMRMSARTTGSIRSIISRLARTS